MIFLKIKVETVGKLIGKLSEFQDEITLAQLKQKLFDEWGGIQRCTTLLINLWLRVINLLNQKGTGG